MKNLLKDKVLWIIIILAAWAASYSYYENRIIEAQRTLRRIERKVNYLEQDVNSHKHNYSTGLSDFAPDW